MNRLQRYIQRINDEQYGFLRDTNLPELIAIDRLCQVLVRCGGCRFTCAAQDVTHLEACVTAGGDYVRDVSFPVGAWERAAGWKPEFTDKSNGITYRYEPSVGVACAVTPQPERRTASQSHAAWFNENDCGGAFDGNQVISDADPGL